VHPDLAALVLAANPSPSPSPSAPPPHGVDWGNVPAWLALTVATAAATVGLLQLRQQSNTLRGEVERNKRRDELLDGQLQEVQQRADDRPREQAESIDVSWVEDTRRGLIHNRSRRPITKVVSRIVETLSDGSQVLHQPEFWEVKEPLGDDYNVRYPHDPVPELRPSATAKGFYKFTDLAWVKFRKKERKDWRLAARFYDDAGRRWQLDQYMHLEPAPDDDW
jgi:hypothetical protein